MNDRFKFRAWDKTENTYIEDAQFTYDDGCEGGTGSFRHYSFRDLLEDKNCIPEQCTGLKDKNGKLIYEGDIVKGKATIGEGNFEYLGCIKWDYQSELIGWYVEDKDGGAWELKQIHARISADNITGEVIGNIHENADLLEVGGK